MVDRYRRLIVSMLAYVAGAIGIAKIFWASGAFLQTKPTTTPCREFADGLPRWSTCESESSLSAIHRNDRAAWPGADDLGHLLLLPLHSGAAKGTVRIDRRTDGSRTRSGRRVRTSALCVILAAAMLTRYDYWFLAGVLAFAVRAPVLFSISERLGVGAATSARSTAVPQKTHSVRGSACDRARVLARLQPSVVWKRDGIRKRQVFSTCHR